MKTLGALACFLFLISAVAAGYQIETLIQQPGKVQSFETLSAGDGKRIYRFELIGENGDVVDASATAEAKAEKKALYLFSVGAEGILSGSAYLNWKALQRYLAQYCLGLPKETVSTIQTWINTTRDKIAENGQGKYVKQFADVKVQLSSKFFVDDTSSVNVEYQRSGTPGAAKWANFCTFK
jgi:hypothetical protein